MNNYPPYLLVYKPYLLKDKDTTVKLVQVTAMNNHQIKFLAISYAYTMFAELNLTSFSWFGNVVNGNFTICADQILPPENYNKQDNLQKTW